MQEPPENASVGRHISLLSQLREGDIVLVEGVRVVGMELNSDIELRINNALGGYTRRFDVVINEGVAVTLLHDSHMGVVVLTDIIFNGKPGSSLNYGMPSHGVRLAVGGDLLIRSKAVQGSSPLLQLHVQSGSNIGFAFEHGRHRSILMTLDQGPAMLEFSGFTVESTVHCENLLEVNVVDGSYRLTISRLRSPHGFVHLNNVTSKTGTRGKITLLNSNKFMLESIRLHSMTQGWNGLQIRVVDSYVGSTGGLTGNVDFVSR